MVSWGELNDLRLGKLNDAVSEWTEMTGKLEKLADGGGEGTSAAALEKKAQAADWSGQNATVTRAFVTKTAREFDDVVGQARSVRNLLRGVHSDFQNYKERQETIRADATRKNLYIDGSGSVKSSTPAPRVVQGGGEILHQATQQEAEGIAADVKKLLHDANDTDRIAARGLRKLAKGKYDFSDTQYTSIKDADRQQARADADTAVDLASGGKMSDPDLRRFNEIAKNQRGDSVFAERFATGMGGEGTLRSWRSLAESGQRNEDGARAKLLGKFQNNLSMTLATASHVDSPAMDKWKQDVIAAGPKEFGHESSRARPYGFQIMGNLMGKGKFDKDFLHDYGDKLYSFEKGDRRDPADLWADPTRDSVDLDFTGKGVGQGTDPMTGFLKASSHNPAYATELFNDDDKADYLLKEREYYSDVDPHGRDWEDDGPMESREALGKALYAGGSGMDPDNPGAGYVKDEEGQKQVMKGALERLAGEENDFPPELRDDMANLIGHHGDDAHKSISAPLGGGPMNQDHLLEVSKQIARNQDSYALLNEQMNVAIVQDIHNETDYPPDSLDKAGRTVGFLEKARYQAINDETEGDLRDASWQQGWSNSTAGATLGYVPVAGPAITSGVSLVTQRMYEDEVRRVEDGATADNAVTSQLRRNQLKALTEEWYSQNASWADADDSKEFSRDHGAPGKIDAAANDGNDGARARAGDG